MVIAIIAILAAILFPVFAQAKLAAKATTAASNARNLGLAVVLYSNDYDDVLPLAAYGTDTAFLLWHDLTDPYVKNKDIWLCPGSTVSVTDTTGVKTSHFGYNVQYLTTFAMDFSNANNHMAVSMGTPQNISETVLFTSARSSLQSSWCGDDGKLLLSPSYPDADCWGRPDPLYTQKAIVAWLDTHVSKKAKSAFYENQTPPDRFFDLE